MLRRRELSLTIRERGAHIRIFGRTATADRSSGESPRNGEASYSIRSGANPSMCRSRSLTFGAKLRRVSHIPVLSEGGETSVASARRLRDDGAGRNTGSVVKHVVNHRVAACIARAAIQIELPLDFGSGRQSETKGRRSSAQPTAPRVNEQRDLTRGTPVAAPATPCGRARSPRGR